MNPFVVVGPALSVWRTVQENRRKVRLTVHRAFFTDRPDEHVFLGVTNASPSRNIVVTHAWFDTTPVVHVIDELPRTLGPGQRFEMPVPVNRLPGLDGIEWLGRASITPDNKVIKSRPNTNVPPVGKVPRQGT